jgi:hypothetical protein
VPTLIDFRREIVEGDEDQIIYTVELKTYELYELFNLVRQKIEAGTTIGEIKILMEYYNFINEATRAGNSRRKS